MPPGSSYCILANGTKIPFEVDNTPIMNFDEINSNLIINGVQYDKSEIKEITFGKSYNAVTTIANFEGFIGGGYTSLEKLDLSGLKNLTRTGIDFLAKVPLQMVDLSSLVNLQTVGDFCLDRSSIEILNLKGWDKVASVGNAFLRRCYYLKIIQIGGVDWSGKTVYNILPYLLEGVSNSSDCTLYANSQDLASKFKTKMLGKISNWTVVIN
jgi:hypothetical protein